MITADWHIPLYDPNLVNSMIRTARENDLSALLISGDFFNFDSLSQYDPKQQNAGLERELREGMAVMNVLLETFDTIYYIWGNHDARLHRALGFAMQFKEAMKMVFGSLGAEAVDRMVFTNLDHMWIEDGFEGSTPWYVCHPQSYNSVPLTSARKIASKVNANVITAHSHHCAVGYGVDGQKIVAEGGGLFDRNKTAYLQRTTTFPTWVQGYSWLKHGHLNVTSPGWTLAGA
jgi:predicted phosphodiesterase